MDVDLNGQWTVLIIINCVLIQLCVIQVCIDENKNFAYFIIKLLWLFNIQFIISSNIILYTYSCTCVFDNLYSIRGKLSFEDDNFTVTIAWGMCSLAVSTQDSPAVEPRSNPGSGKILMSENLRLYTTSPVVMC